MLFKLLTVNFLLILTIWAFKEVRTLNLKSERGASIVETLIAMAIFLSSVSYAVLSISQMIKFSSARAAIGLMFESDQVIRYELRSIMTRVQRRITEMPPASQCYGQTVKWFFEQVAKEQDLAEIAAFGEFSRIASKKTAFHTRIANSFNQVKQKIDKISPSNLSAQSLRDAIRKCESQQTLSVTPWVKDRRSLYMCGYGENFIIEAKVVFFDFNTTQVLTCNMMNERPGRGFKVFYQIHNFIKASSDDPEFQYAIRKNGGIVEITKDVDAI